MANANQINLDETPSIAVTSLDAALKTNRHPSFERKSTVQIIRELGSIDYLITGFHLEHGKRFAVITTYPPGTAGIPGPVTFTVSF